ncbi:hypothetical protein ONS96_001541 [Cadophora gregata f. sp. sojae]|nr:hypothetical protein ONS96_001541 [Cadophora gregata f. sp. sojae]
MVDRRPDVEKARKEALAAQLATWKEKEAARLEKRRRNKLAVGGTGNTISSRGSSAGTSDTGNVWAKNGSYQREKYILRKPPVVQHGPDMLLFKPENLRPLHDKFTKDEGRKWESTLSAYWHRMSTRNPEFQV